MAIPHLYGRTPTGTGQTCAEDGRRRSASASGEQGVMPWTLSASLEKQGTITEDELRRAQDDIQKLTDK